jgi:hypothetical protein
VAADRGERQVRAVAGAPQTDLVVAQRGAQRVDVVGALNRRVAPQVDAARRPERGCLAGEGDGCLQPLLAADGAVERQVPAHRRGQVRPREAGPALVQQDDVAARAQRLEPGDRLVPQELGNAGTAWTAGQEDDRRLGVGGRSRQPGECQINWPARRIGAVLRHA